ncbi:MAG: hypothetical protein ACQEXJ_17590 [Myxococcota bacterium]
MTLTNRTVVPMALCVAALLVATACRSETTAGAEERATEAAETDREGPPFELKIEVPDLDSGAKGAAVVTIVAGEGFKWNDEYPAKLTFEVAPEHVALGKKKFQQTGGDFDTSEEQASVSVPLEAKSAGEETVTGKAKFSVCNDTTCLIETADVELAVNVR